MGEGHTLTLAVGLLGNVIGLLLYASPMPVFVRIVRRRATEAFSGVPYAVGLLSSMQWSYYAVLRGRHARPLLLLTSLGFLLLLTFNTLFLRFAPPYPRRALQVLLLCTVLCFFAAMTSITATSLSGNLRTNVVGIICATTSVCFSASPLLIARRVMKTRSVEFMPFYLPLFTFLSGITWGFFSWLTRDIILAVPNCVNILLGAIQLTLYGYYTLVSRRRRRRHGDQEQLSQPHDFPIVASSSSSAAAVHVHGSTDLPDRACSNAVAADRAPHVSTSDVIDRSVSKAWSTGDLRETSATSLSNSSASPIILVLDDGPISSSSLSPSSASVSPASISGASARTHQNHSEDRNSGGGEQVCVLAHESHPAASNNIVVVEEGNQVAGHNCHPLATLADAKFDGPGSLSN